MTGRRVVDRRVVAVRRTGVGREVGGPRGAGEGAGPQSPVIVEKYFLRFNL